MSRRDPGFDRMARWYRALEFLAFGGDLERARFEFLGRLRGCREILLLGEGDGRCAERVARLSPQARILCVDSSAGMVERASRRIAAAGAADRVRFRCADALAFEAGGERYDAVATLFFLDCLTDASVEALVARIGACLGPGAPWLVSDFNLPEGGLSRARARAWLGFLYACFRWETAIAARALPSTEAILARSGWVRSACRDRQGGLLRSAVFERAAPA
jgi:ubiquinone/menaquinone biosynthesis C-methylase UbiE